MTRLTQVKSSEFDMTLGKLQENFPYLFIQDAATRGTVPSTSGSSACIQFRYLGETSTLVLSGEGTEFHQIGLKLLSQNPCNLLYVMWRIKPRDELVILVKQNLGKNRSDQCKNCGYTTIYRRSFPSFKIGEYHELLGEASLINSGEINIKVWVDLQEVISVSIDPRLIQNIQGVSGIRSENGKYQLRYLS